MASELDVALKTLAQRYSAAKSAGTQRARMDLAYQHNYVGILYEQAGDFKNAYLNYQSALSAMYGAAKMGGADTPEARLGMAMSYMNLAYLQKAQGKSYFDNAVLARREADALAGILKEVKLLRGLDKVYWGIGELMEKDDPVGCFEAYKKAIAVNERVVHAAESLEDFERLGKQYITVALWDERHPDMALLKLAYLAFVRLSEHNPNHGAYRQNVSDIQNIWKQFGLCTYCGGSFKGMLRKTCQSCGKPKAY